ncbi:hypothetical protein FRC07_013224 [Ceratobasidium sp. 392]|nr:hypothetical protein FRC07_013224 [Ceratobasidium sp. 392]
MCWQTVLSDKQRAVSMPTPSVAGTSSASARKEVLSGYCLLLNPATSSSCTVSNPSSSSGRGVFTGKGKGKGKGKAFGLALGKSAKPAKAKPVTIRRLYVIPYAFWDAYKVVNNSGAVNISCPTLSKGQREALVKIGYGRMTTATNPVTLDKSLDSTATAATFAHLLDPVYQAYCAHNDHSQTQPAPIGWCVELVQRGKTLRIGDENTAMKDIIKAAHTNSCCIDTREIFLAVSAGLDCPFEPGKERIQKGKKLMAPPSDAEEDSSEDTLDEDSDEPSIKLEHASSRPAKRRKLSSPELDNDLAPSPLSESQNQVLQPQPRPRLRQASPSNAASTSHAEANTANPYEPEPTGMGVTVASPAPTVIEVEDSDSNLQVTSLHLAHSLSLGDAPQAWNIPEDLNAGSSEEHAVHDNLDPFADDYTI